ncbi:MAG: metal-dependent hydrolase HDOD [Gammaproteobacteria bacterium]|nr:MAG: metal-dependent hydrolase HDOD [Gammaproteobacteria bacterium]TND06939.1 MAG: metal-dependent hydrolase HDOD [Gammaproteobacteria bacterium]
MGQTTMVANQAIGAGFTKKTQIIDAIRADLSCNRLTLPALPEVVVKMRKTVDDPAASAAQMAKAISAEPAIATRLLQVANAALYRSRTRVDSIQGAIARLGLKMVRNLVCTLVMEQLYKVRTSEKIRQMQISIWRHSVSVAALSSVLAARFTSLGKDEAMLGGLVHDIGKLPILARAATIPELGNDDELLQAVLDDMHGEVGKLVLETWHFPESLVRCVARHEQYDDIASPEIDICDVVTLANLCSHPLAVRERMIADFDRLPVLEKLELDAATLIGLINEAQPEIHEIEQLLIR